MQNNLEEFLATNFKPYPNAPFTHLYLSAYGDVWNSLTKRFHHLRLNHTQYLCSAVDPDTGKRYDLSVRILVKEAWKNVSLMDIPRDTIYLKFFVMRDIFNKLKSEDYRIISEDWLPWYKQGENRPICVTKEGQLWNMYHKFPVRIETHTDNYQYAHFQINDKYKKSIRRTEIRRIAVHRLVALAFIPLPQRYIDLKLTFDDLEVNHKDMNRSNNKVENLEWCTTQENALHAVQNREYAPINHIAPPRNT